MNDVILCNAVSRLGKGDILYFLGDLTFKKGMANDFFNVMHSLGVQVHFIFGNHDYNIIRIIKDGAAWSGDLKSIKIKEQSITLCHYAMRVWNKSHFNAWHLYGHSHGGLSNDTGITFGKAYDIGVDNNSFQILSFDEIKNIMDSLPDNFNYIKRDDRR
jgi:calcineurin-like phosphoesterase family protein